MKACHVAVSIFVLCSCGGVDSSSFGGYGGGFGATPGGGQDIGLAREMIEDGIVPPPEAFLVEGMFSEHDLGLAGPRCERTLCLRGALGIAPTLEGDKAGWLQVGLSSTIDPATYERPSMTVIMTVDVSGSMGWDYTNEEGETPSPGELSRRLLHDLGSQLGEGDRVAIVTYGSEVETRLPVTDASEQAIYHATVDALTTNGSTNMEAGLRRAFDLAEEAASDGVTDQVRVMLFTDVRPNVGATTASEFGRLVEQAADSDIGITVFGLGLGLGQEVMNAMSHIRGGNAFSLFDFEDADELLAHDWPWLASPIAYDLYFELQPSEGFAIAETYGFPGADTAIALDVATVFLSERKGALLVRLTPENDFGGMRVEGDIFYVNPDGTAVEDQLVIAYGDQPVDERGHYFQQAATAKATALAILVDAMADATEVYGESPEQAVALMREAHDRFAADITGLDDGDLVIERKLAADLLALMADGAPQTDPYGAY